jgi:hypothetical protein
MALERKPQDYSFTSGLANVNPAELPPEALEKYKGTLQQGIEALEKRYNEPNWFKVAAGFAKPQLGGFIASLGSAAEAAGETEEQRREQMLPVAQMKAEIDRAAAAGHLSAADVAEAKADLDQELAEGLADAQEALEEARRDAEAARTEAEAARADAEAQSHARPISTAISSAMPARCGKGATLSSFVQQVALPDGPTRVLRVAVCKPDAKATRAMVRQSLAQARAQIAGDPMIPADLRQSILTALDVRMEDEPAHLPLS